MLGEHHQDTSVFSNTEEEGSLSVLATTWYPTWHLPHAHPQTRFLGPRYCYPRAEEARAAKQGCREKGAAGKTCWDTHTGTSSFLRVGQYLCYPALGGFKRPQDSNVLIYPQNVGWWVSFLVERLSWVGELGEPMPFPSCSRGNPWLNLRYLVCFQMPLWKCLPCSVAPWYGSSRRLGTWMLGQKQASRRRRLCVKSPPLSTRLLAPHRKPGQSFRRGEGRGRDLVNGPHAEISSWGRRCLTDLVPEVQNEKNGTPDHAVLRCSYIYSFSKWWLVFIKAVVVHYNAVLWWE